MQAIQKDFRVTMMWQFLPQTDLALSTILLAGGTSLSPKYLWGGGGGEGKAGYKDDSFSGVISDASGQLHPCSDSSTETHLIISGE